MSNPDWAGLAKFMRETAEKISGGGSNTGEVVMGAVAKEKDELLPKDIVRMALAASNNIVQQGVEWMLAWIMDHPEWIAVHQDAILRAWVQGHMNNELNYQRNSCLGTGAKQKGARSENIVSFQSALTEAINSNYSRMMDAPLYGGKRIGDATPAEIRASAEQFQTNGKSMLKKAVWQFRVAEKAEENGCGVNEPVRTALTPKTFEELWEASDVA